MKATTNFGKSSFSSVMGVKKSDGYGQEVEDKQGERANRDSFNMET